MKIVINSVQSPIVYIYIHRLSTAHPTQMHLIHPFNTNFVLQLLPCTECDLKEKNLFFIFTMYSKIGNEKHTSSCKQLVSDTKEIFQLLTTLYKRAEVPSYEFVSSLFPSLYFNLFF